MTWNSDTYKNRWNEVEDFYNYQLKENKNMKNGVGTLSWVNIKSALMFALLTAIAGVIIYILGIGDVFKLELNAVTNIFVLAFANGMLSIIKSLLTTNSGQFGGVQTVDKS